MVKRLEPQRSWRTFWGQWEGSPLGCRHICVQRIKQEQWRCLGYLYEMMRPESRLRLTGIGKGKRIGAQLRRKVGRIWCPWCEGERWRQGQPQGPESPSHKHSPWQMLSGRWDADKTLPCTPPTGGTAGPTLALIYLYGPWGESWSWGERREAAEECPLLRGFGTGIGVLPERWPTEPGCSRPAKTASGWNGFWVPRPRRRLIFLINSEAMKQGMRLEWAGPAGVEQVFSSTASLHPTDQLPHPSTDPMWTPSNDHCGHSRPSSKAVWHCDEKQRLWNQIDPGPNLNQKSLPLLLFSLSRIWLFVTPWLQSTSLLCP